jgi:hypothetical protein
MRVVPEIFNQVSSNWEWTIPVEVHDKFHVTSTSPPPNYFYFDCYIKKFIFGYDLLISMIIS